MKKLFIALNLVLVSLWSCKDGGDPVEPLAPTLSVSTAEVGETTAQITIDMKNAKQTTYLFKVDDNTPFTETELLAGNKVAQSKTITLNALTANTKYIFSAIAVNEAAAKTEIKSLTFTTNEAPKPVLPSVEIGVEDITQSSVLISYTMSDATAMYVNYRVNTGEITEEELLKSGKAYESVSENVMGLTPNTEYIVGAMAVNENTGEKSEVIIKTFTTLEPANDDKVNFEGDFIVARLQYRGAAKDNEELGLYEGIFATTEKLTMDGSGFVFPDFEQPTGLLIKLNAFADLVESEETTVPTICGEYTISKDEVAKFKIDQYTGNSYVTTLNNGTPALYSIESGTMTITKEEDSYKYDFDFVLQNTDDETEEPQQLKYSYVGEADYDNTTIFNN